jgi:hypothetical protein
VGASARPQGRLAVVRNGWPADPAQLDALAQAACAAGDALRDACLLAAPPRTQPFDQPLPTADWPARGVSLDGAFPPSPWLEALRTLAGELGMTLEQPAAHHGAFPSLPVPGDLGDVGGFVRTAFGFALERGLVAP